VYCVVVVFFFQICTVYCVFVVLFSDLYCVFVVVVGVGVGVVSVIFGAGDRKQERKKSLFITVRSE
jgi:hypothetical protein